MSQEVIAVLSSDEDEPPTKKNRPRLNLSECTITLVDSKKKQEISTGNAPTVTIVLDDENVENTDPKTGCRPDSSTEHKKSHKSLVSSDLNEDLITLTDDEEDITPKINSNHSEEDPLQLKIETNLKNGKKPECTQDTVFINDSDSELETPAKEKLEETDKKSNVSIVITDTDEELEKQTKYAVKDEKEIQSPIKPKDETEEAKVLFHAFLNKVKEKIENTAFEEILPKKLLVIEKYFNKSGLYVNEKAFLSVLEESISSIQNASTSNGTNSALLAFHKICAHLKAHLVQSSIEIEEHDLPKVKKLESTMKLLKLKIKELEEAEVDFSDDADSAYIQLDLYQKRLNKVYKKYCQYIKRNPYSGRAAYSRISFVNSDYNEINLAITNKFKNSSKFPTYFELNEFIKNIVKENNLSLNEDEISTESKKCFKTLGGIIQKKRQQDLYESHIDYIESTEDPAVTDPELDNILKKNQVEGQEKIKVVVQKFVDMAEKGEDKVSEEEKSHSSESERSVDSDEEEDKKSDNENST